MDTENTEIYTYCHTLSPHAALPIGRSMMTTRGRFLCGEVTYECDVAENWRAYCHCESCRRNTSSPVTAFFGVSRSAFRFTGKAPAVYASSPGVRRLFCGRCGSPMAYETDRRPQEIDRKSTRLNSSH